MTQPAGVEVLPVRGIPEVRAGDDLARLILDAAGGGGLAPRDGDVVVVTQKVVSKAEGRVVPIGAEGKAGWVARETRRVVARRADLVIAETRHGLVCANAGVDASNVAEGFVSLLPEDPDASAGRILAALQERTGVRLSVVVTDTFGRAWRRGLVNVAIGCAGLPALVDLRGTTDATGMVLEATVVALADEIAAASGLVIGKADGTPAAIVRGILPPEGPAQEPQPAAVLVRPPEEDMFRTSPLLAAQGESAEAPFADGPAPSPTVVPREALVEAVRAAAAADPGGSWAFVLVESAAARRRLLGALADGSLEAASVLAVPCLRVPGPGGAPGDVAAAWLGAGGAIRAFVLAMTAQGLAARWQALAARSRGASAGASATDVRDALGLGDEWAPLGAVGIGRLAHTQGRTASAEEPLDVSERSRFL